MPKIAVINSNNTSFTVTDGLFKQSYPLVDSSTNLVNNVDGSQTLYLLWGDEVVVVVENTLNSSFAGNSIFGATTPLTAQTAAQTAIGAAGSGGGGGGGTTTTPADIATGINQAVDIDTLLLAIANIDSKIPKGGYESKVTVTRPANTTAYIANSVYGNVFELTNIGAAGGHIILSGVRIFFTRPTLPAGMAGFVLFLYSGVPPTVVADGGAFSIPTADQATLLTPKGIDLENAEVAIGGGSVVVQVDNKNVQLKLANGVTSLWGQLVTRSAFTPTAGEIAKITAIALGV